MSEILNSLKTRRSIRKYEDRPLPQELLDQVMEAVQWSQSWSNSQCWEVIVVKDQETRLRLQETLSPKNPGTKAMVSSSVLLVLCGKKAASGYYDGKPGTILNDWMLYDLGIATQSLCLVAHDLGLGTVVLGLFDHEKVAQILEVPDTVQVVSMIPLGYPGHTPKPPIRKALADFCHTEHYSH